MPVEATLVKATSLNNLTSSSQTNFQQQQENIVKRQQQFQACSKQLSTQDNNTIYWSDKTSAGKRRRRATRSARSARSNQRYSSSISARNSYQLQRPSVCRSLIGRILHTVGELEHTLIEDHLYDYKREMALEQQSEKIDHLRSSLENEKQRNYRLVQLIHSVDSCSSDGDASGSIPNTYRIGRDGGWGASHRQSRLSMDAFESISPLLMKQRYDELSVSHKQCQRQLAKKDKLLTLTKCDKEELQSKYEHLLDEYRNAQQRFEDMCCKFLQVQSKKNQKIQRMIDALTFASDCVLSARSIIECRADGHNANTFLMEFRQNLQLYTNALQLCD